MKKYEFHMTTGFAGSEHVDTVEYEFDNETDEEIEEILDNDLRDWANGYIDMWYEEVKEPNQPTCTLSGLPCSGCVRGECGRREGESG